MKTLAYITRRKQEILKMIDIDHKIKADAYDDVARLKEVEKIEKILKQEIRKRNR